MSLILYVNPAVTGGTSTTLTNSGQTKAGESQYTFPGSSRLLPRVLKIYSNTPVTTAANPGTVRAGFRLILGNRVEEQGCCTVKEGTVLVNVEFVWPLNQPSSLVDEAISQLQAMANNKTVLEELVKNGAFPS